MITTILAATILTSAAMGQTKSNNQKSITMGKQKIINTVTAIFNGSDERNWSKVENSFAGEVTLDYTSMAGGTPSKMSPQQITTAWKTILPGFQSTHHQIGNFIVNMDGRAATVHHRGLALHYLPNTSGNNVWVVVGTYDFTLTKDDADNWKVTGMKFNLQEQEGNLDLPKFAQQNVKEGVSFKNATVSVKNKAVIEKFFTSLEALDISAFLTVWSENGKQLMPLSPGNFPKQLNGKQAIYNQYKGLPENYTSMRFQRKYIATDDPNTVIVQYNGIIPLKEGGEYNNNYVGIFKLDNGKLQQFTEYFDPFILQEAFGRKIESNFNVADNTAKIRKAEFLSNGLILKGNLFLPANYKQGDKLPVIITVGPFTQVKEQVAAVYSKKMSEAGFAAFAFDFRYWGESEGLPRYFESPKDKIEDIRNAVTYLQTLPEIDSSKIGIIGICFGAGYVAKAVADDNRIKSWGTVAAWLNDEENLVKLFSQETLDYRDNLSVIANKAFVSYGKMEYAPAYEVGNKKAAMFFTVDYYGNPERGAIPQWTNQYALISHKVWHDFNIWSFDTSITTPALFVHSDGSALPQNLRKLYNDVKGPKELYWSNGEHTEFYDKAGQVDDAAQALVKHFKKTLN